MKDRSTMTIRQFLFSLIWKFGIGFIWYKNLLFRTLPHWRTSDSLRLFFGMLLVSAVGLAIVCRRRRNGWTTTACFALPLGAYTIMVYADTFPVLIRNTAAAAGVIAMVYSVFLLTRKAACSSRRARRRVYRNRIARCAYSTACIAAVAMLLLMTCAGCNKFFGTALISPSVKAKSPAEETENTDTMAFHMDTVLKLRPDVWEQQSVRQRLDILQTVCNIEVRYLGLSGPVTVQSDNLSEFTLGTYLDDMRLVVIDLAHIENDPVEEVLDTLLHEVHHSYEYRLAEAYDDASPELQRLRLFRSARHYAQETGDYIDPKEDYSGYISQYMELDSATYAEFGVQAYFERIDEWLTETP